MRKILIFSVITLLSASCKNEAKVVKVEEAPAVAAKTETADTTTKKVTLAFASFSFGDLPHYFFKDVSTGQESEYEFDEQDAGYAVAKDEIDQSCLDEDVCKTVGQKYDAQLQFKLLDIYDWNGEVLVPTGKKENRWVVTSLVKK